MNGFQIIGILMCASFSLFVLMRIFKRRRDIPINIFWLGLWISGGILIFKPEYTKIMARSLGITRGADLIFYITSLFALVSGFFVYMKIRSLQFQITKLTRELALRDSSDH